MTLIKGQHSFKYHVLIGLVLALWLTVFLVLIAPFDISELPFEIRLEIMPVYGLISFVGYVLIIPFQLWGERKGKSSTAFFEVVFILLFNVLVLAGSYFYYQSGIVNGEYSFSKFALEVFLPIFFILLPIIVIARWYVRKKSIPQDTGIIVLRGDNKLDVLQLKSEELICVSSADNYVDVTYLVNGSSSKKLLRTTLKNIELQHPELVKVHRSHLINPIHFKEWKDANTLLLTQIEVPVSKSYKKHLSTLGRSSLKTNNSPLSH